MSNPMKNLKTRIIQSLIITIILFTLIYFSHKKPYNYIFLLALSTIVSLSVFEYYRFSESLDYTPCKKIGIIGSFCFIPTLVNPSLINPAIIIAIVVLASFISFFITGKNPIANIAITLFPYFYLVFPLSCFLMINYAIPNGRWWLLFLILVTKMTDTAAYFIGKKLGRNKLAPYISPNKTWEGAIAGLIFGVLTGWIMYFISPHLTLLSITFLSIGISILGQFGDLAESLLKRDAGIKNSFHIPGLGGVLDILDSLIFTTPFLYSYLMLVGGH